VNGQHAAKNDQRFTYQGTKFVACGLLIIGSAPSPHPASQYSTIQFHCSPIQKRMIFMRYNALTVGLAMVAAFGAGSVLSPLDRFMLPNAHAASVPLSPAVIDLTAITYAQLPNTPYPELHAKGLVATDNATVGIQIGNLPKHLHPQTDEIQYIIEGSGSMWLGNERKDFKPGSLIVIPKGMAHAGSIVTSGPVKAIAIKIPPQPKDDTVMVD
jgi:mannose-6-phosphate isomerase-like protein (cupin superfamily)